MVDVLLDAPGYVEDAGEEEQQDQDGDDGVVDSLCWGATDGLG